MKGVAVILVAIFALGQASSDRSFGELDAAFAQIGSVLAKQIESQLRSAILGKNAETFEVDGIPLLPNPVYLKGQLNTAVLHGLGDLKPEVKLDIIKRTLDVKYTIPAARIEGDYSLALSAAEDFETLIIATGSGLGSFQFNDIQLDINAKLKGTIITGWRIDYLTYNLAPFTIDADLDKVLLFNNVDVSEVVEPFLGWYLHKELVSLEEGAHEPLVNFIISVIDKVLCPICSA